MKIRSLLLYNYASHLLLEAALYPILFSISDIPIHASVVFLIAGLLVGMLVGAKEGLRVGFTKKEIVLFFISGVPLTLAFGALNALAFGVGILEIFENLEYALSSGLISFGAILGAFLWGFLFSKIIRSEQPIGLMLDTIAVIAPLILGIYRIGCILNGCCYGLETDTFLGIYLPGYAGQWADRFPTQIMLLLFNFGLFAWLWPQRKRKPFHGSLTLSYLFVYALGRLVIDSLRDLPHALGPFSLHQLTAATILLATGYIIFEFRHELRKTTK